MTDNFSQVHWSHKSYNWDTPLDIFLELNEEFNFNLDPTSRPIHNLPGLNDGLREKWYFSKRFEKLKLENGKRIPYTRAFVNPPYGPGVIEKWVQKCLNQIRLDIVSLAAFLIPLRNSGYFKLMRKNNAEFRLCDKRLKFGDADNSSETKKDKIFTCPHCQKDTVLRKAKPNENNSAPFDSVVAILRNPKALQF